MKRIVNYILEKLVINKNTKIEDIKYNKSNYQEAIKNLEDEAKRYGYKIKFRNRTTSSGDFTIFIYDLNQDISKTYKVGFDGDWLNDNEFSFDSCYKRALEWLEKHENHK